MFPLYPHPTHPFLLTPSPHDTCVMPTHHRHACMHTRYTVSASHGVCASPLPHTRFTSASHLPPSLSDPSCPCPLLCVPRHASPPSAQRPGQCASPATLPSRMGATQTTPLRRSWMLRPLYATWLGTGAGGWRGHRGWRKGGGTGAQVVGEGSSLIKCQVQLWCAGSSIMLQLAIVVGGCLRLSPDAGLPQSVSASAH